MKIIFADQCISWMIEKSENEVTPPQKMIKNLN